MSARERFSSYSLLTYVSYLTASHHHISAESRDRVFMESSEHPRSAGIKTQTGTKEQQKSIGISNLTPSKSPDFNIFYEAVQKNNLHCEYFLIFRPLCERMNV